MFLKCKLTGIVIHEMNNHQHLYNLICLKEVKGEKKKEEKKKGGGVIRNRKSKDR